MTVPVNHELTFKRRLYTLIAILIFFLLGMAYVIYYIGWARFEEETDDAYVNGNMIMLTPQIEGIVTSILADNAQLVEEGQTIIEIDPSYYAAALEQASADLAEAVRQVAQLFIRIDQLDAAVMTRKAALLRANLDYEHRKALVGEGGVAREDYEHSETTLMSSYSQVIETQEMLHAAYAEVEGTTIATHPLVEQMKAAFKVAYLGWRRCKVLSPVRGIVTQRQAQVGQWVGAQYPLLSIVPLDQIWVDANYREVQLENLRIGQPVTMFSDMYGRGMKFHGTVLGLNPGTGSVFSVLPPQNATGNWIKIVQRIPVRLAIDPEEIKKHPLVLGLSMTTTVDTHNRMGLQVPEKSPDKLMYQTTVYDDELADTGAMIERIIAENSPNDSP